jgi:hypothetical protein
MIGLGRFFAYETAGCIAMVGVQGPKGGKRRSKVSNILDCISALIEHRV